MEACKYWRETGKGCDEPILLGNSFKAGVLLSVSCSSGAFFGIGNDPLYGGLGGTPTWANHLSTTLVNVRLIR